jgi:hypothetical protein
LNQAVYSFSLRDGDILDSTQNFTKLLQIGAQPVVMLRNVSPSDEWDSAEGFETAWSLRG